MARGVVSKPAIAESDTRVVFSGEVISCPCNATAPVVFWNMTNLLPVFYPDLKKEFSEVRSGSKIGRKSHFCPQALQPQAFSAEASQTMKQSTLRPKSAIAEISTRGRTKGAPEIGNCPNQHRGTPHNHLTSKLATTTTGSRGAYLLDVRLHPFIAFHGNRQRALCKVK